MTTHQTMPAGGDVVICTAGALIGNIAYVNGDTAPSSEPVSLCFNARPFFDGDSVSCSGGMRHQVNASALIPTGKTSRVAFEQCAPGYNGFPNGEVSERDVTVWEYHDTTPTVFTDTFSIEDILSRMQGDYVFEVRSSPSPLAKHFDGSDPVGRAIFEAAKRFEAISWYEHDRPSHLGDRFTLQIGINQIASFKNRLGFEQFIKAFNLELHHVEDNAGYLIPNMDVENWAPTGWRQRTDMVQ